MLSFVLEQRLNAQGFFPFSKKTTYWKQKSATKPLPIPGNRIDIVIVERMDKKEHLAPY